jgi:long-subunit fatty acid transport protein
LDSFSVAAGIEYKVNDSMTVNVGVFDVIYSEGQNSASASYPITDTYNKTSIGVAVGVGYRIK